jgi:glycosyltransferase involved in cell wall biosynthesis
MKVSLITVSFNSKATIQDTIDSVKAQTYAESIEYIVVDGDSTDGTKLLLNQESFISKFISEKDRGIYDAMNKGLQLATGEVVGFINSDDILLDNNVIQDIADAFDQAKADVIYANLYYVDRNDTSKIVRKWESKPYHQHFFEFGNVPPHPTFFIRTRLLNKIGLFNLKYKLAADYEFMFRALKIHNLKSYHLPRFTIKMRLGGATNVSVDNIKKQNLEILDAWSMNDKNVPFYFFPARIWKKIIQFF